jgi:hypothetical protein
MSNDISNESSENSVSAVADLFNNQEFLKREWDGRQTDWLLQWLCQLINKHGLAIGVTLTVGGTLVTGTLISHDKYFEQFSEDFSAPFAVGGTEAQEQMRSIILGFNPAVDPDEQTVALQYIHLKNARTYVSSSDHLPTNGALWRGKIAAVDGFILGSLE